MVTEQEKQAFNALIDEYRKGSKAQLGQEVFNEFSLEYDPEGPPYNHPWILTDDMIRDFAYSQGDDNPLFTDKEYAKKSTHGCLIAPGVAMMLVRDGMWNGIRRIGGWPLANFHAGNAWEFYDVIRSGTTFKVSAKAGELLEKPSNQGTMFLFISDTFYWDSHGDLLGKQYGTQIMVQREEMGTSRVMKVERLGEKLMYTRSASKYNKEQIDEVFELAKNAKPRGKTPRYWEDVEIGDKLPAFVLPPWTDQDYTGYSQVRRGGVGRYFEEAYLARRFPRQGFNETTYTHPVSMWPWSPGAEHGDALMAAYRGQALPFDWGGQRGMIPSALFTNWMGDDGFLRRLQLALRRPMYYGDLGIYRGEVTKKFTEEQVGEKGPGATDGKVTYHAVGVKWEGVNQVGQTHTAGTATIYLPSKTKGKVQLPIPHAVKPPFVSYEKFYRDWYQ